MIAGPKLEAEFANAYGERFLVRVAPNRKTGELMGDETDWEAILIHHDRVLGSFMLAADEYDALAAAWLEMTGRTLEKPAYLQAFEMWAALRGAGCQPPA
jgi:hypothetical protein